MVEPSPPSASSAPAITAIIVAGIAALATITVGYLNYRRQGKSHNEQLALIRSGQVTDRFTKAIDQLGSSNVSVRVGAIFALERIARDSPIYCANIVEVLAAFVRDRLPTSNLKESSGYVHVLLSQAPDAQTALTVLSRSPLCDERVKSKEPDLVLLDLSRTDLRRAMLSHANLQRVNLWGTRLEGADFRHAHLEGAILEYANFGRFEPNNPSFERGTDLSFADLTGAKLKGAKNWGEAVTKDAIGLAE